MPQAIVTLPDGRRAKISGPSQEAIMAAAQSMASPVDTSPFPLPSPPDVGGFPAGPFAPPPTLFGRDQYSPTERAAAAQGVDITSGSDVGRIEAGLAPNEAFKEAAVRDLLGKRYGEDIQVRSGSKSPSGKLEFLNPKTKRWTMYDEAGFSPADIKDMYGPGLVVGGSTVGGVGGAVAGGGAGSIAGAAGGGAFLGEFWRLKEGQRLGVHNLTDSQIAAEAAKTAGLEAAASYTGEKLLHLGQLAKRFFSPRPIKQSEAAELLSELDAALETGVTGVSTSIPQKTGNIAMQGELERATLSDADLINLQAKRERENRSAVDDWYERTFEPDQQAATNTGASLAGAVDQSNAAALERTIRQTQSLEAPVKSAVESLPIYNEGGMGRSARETVKAHWDDLTQKKNVAWQKYESAIGQTTSEGKTTSKYQLDFTPGPGIKGAIETAQNAWFKGQRAEASQAIPDAIAKGGRVDLADVNRGIQWIRNRIRDQRSGTITSDLGTYQLEAIEKDLVKARAAFLEKTDPSALKALEEAEAASRLRGEFERSTLGQWLRKDGDAYVMSNYQVFRELFKSRDVEAAQSMGALVANDPQKRLAFQNSVWALYREEATKGGVPDPVLHEKFIQQYGDMAKAFFGKDEWAKVSRFGEMADGLQKNAEQVTSYLKGLNTRLSRKLTSTNPETVLDFVLSKNASVKDVRTLRRLMSGAGALPKDALSGLGARVWRQITTESGEIDLGKLQGLLKNSSGHITEFTGSAQYVANLRKLSIELERMNRKGTAQTRAMSPYQRVSRVILRPLSREGLARTAAIETVYRPRAARVVYEILTDKDKLAEYVRLGERQASNRQVAQFLATVGGASLLSEE